MKNCDSIKIVIFLILVFFDHSLALARPMEERGQASAWMSLSDEKPLRTRMGLRYIPGFYIKQSINSTSNLDVQLSLNAYNSTQFMRADGCDSEWRIKPYRAWVRFSTNQFELRAGLQKINFGSASLFRPLMWFDQIDPRDPLQITDGVYGLLLRYYFLNNANVWLWGLYGNDDPKGWEVFPTEKESVEYGGRFQAPMFTGEIGVSCHFRRADIKSVIIAQLPPALVHMMSRSDQLVDENRFSVDGKWDAGVSFWLESVFVQQKSEFLPFEWRRSVTAGMDYTFNIGNGITFLGEYFTSTSSEKIFGNGEGIRFLALSANYPVGLLDRLGAIFYVDLENDELYRFVSWQRAYDHWSFYLFGFWNPENFKIYNNADNSSPLAGKGFQFMIVFNH